MPGDLPIPPDLLIQFSTQCTVNELIHCLAIPPAIHIGFTQTQSYFADKTVVEAFIMDLDIPGIAPINLDICHLEQFCDDAF
jgi:hypothetical protein